jgi:hypothetical protein
MAEYDNVIIDGRVTACMCRARLDRHYYRDRGRHHAGPVFGRTVWWTQNTSELILWVAAALATLAIYADFNVVVVPTNPLEEKMHVAD